STAMAPCTAKDSSAFSACRAEKDDAQRLACYDREADRLAQQQPATAVPPPAAGTAQTPEERFGYRGVLAREEYDRDKQETRRLEELVATVTEISARPDGALVMTLDNGQVWRQNRPDSFFHLKVGEQVKIEPAALGSFLLSGSSKRSTRVTRVR
ncbi:MAG: hypothetical protein AAB263_21910, partial [Planctomycetota bacterium]